MITKLPWKSQNHVKHVDFAYNKRKDRSFIITDRDFSIGKSLLDATFESAVAPLIVTSRVSFETIPKDGNYQNADIDNILISGFGKHLGINEENGKNNEILRLEYDPDDQVYSYIFVLNGANEEFRGRNFKKLRTKCARSPKIHGFRNKRYLLTAEEYKRFYYDYTTQNVNIDAPNFDISLYKTSKYEQDGPK